jgi:hypothetical protein
MSLGALPAFVCDQPGCSFRMPDDEVIVCSRFLDELRSEVASLSRAIDAVGSAWSSCIRAAESDAFDWWEAYSQIRWAAAPVIRAARMLFPLPTPPSARPGHREPGEEGGRLVE